MSDLVDIAGSILAQSQQRAEVIGENLANATTPAYRRRVAFSSLLEGKDAANATPAPLATATDATPGKLVHTDERFDLAITGRGTFAIRQDDALRFSRAGRFTRRDDGRLIDALGGVLQSAGGDDLLVAEATEIGADGSIVTAGAETGRIAVYDALPGRLTDDAELLPPQDIHLVSGAYEASNVSTGAEMTQLMLALRLAESGQRVMLAYDDIMGRALTAFGENVR